MFTDEQLDELKAFAGGAPLLSVYLNVPPGLQPERAYITSFRALAQQVRDGLPPPQQEGFEAEADAVVAWLDREPPQGQGFVAFSCQPAGLWQAAFLPFAIEDHVAFEDLPHLTPLLDLYDEHERYGVVIVDKEQARLLTIRLGQIEGDRRFRSDVEIEDERVGWDEGKYERQYAARVGRHLKLVAARLETLHRRRPFARLFLGGPLEAASALKGLLSPALADCLAGTFNVDIDMPPSEILERTATLAEQAERAGEVAIVDTLFDRAGGVGRGIVGVAPTLRAVWNAAVDTLVVAGGLQVPGGECPNCGRLDDGNVVACPACQGATRPVSDVVAWAIDRTLQQSGAVEIVHGDAATRLLEGGEGLGALLRYSQDGLA